MQNKTDIKNFHKDLMDLIVKYNFSEIEIESKPHTTGWKDDYVVHKDKISFKFNGIFETGEV